MAKVRNISENPLSLRMVNQIVEPDAQVEVPDALFAEHDWPDTVWEVVDTGKRVFDPNAKTVAEVNAYLEKADDEERARVLTVERNGQARKGIIGEAE